MPKGIYIHKKHTNDIKDKMRISHLGKKYKPMSIQGRENIKKGLRSKKEWRGEFPKCIDCNKQLTSFVQRCIKCSGIKKRNENSPLWITDRTKLKKSDKKHLDYQYKMWMLEVKKRDNWKCRLLNSECNGRLEAHHILNWIDHPELRYIINNGITLCAFHHPIGREKEKRMIPIFQELLSVSEEIF